MRTYAGFDLYAEYFIHNVKKNVAPPKQGNRNKNYSWQRTLKSPP